MKAMNSIIISRVQSNKSENLVWMVCIQGTEQGKNFCRNAYTAMKYAFILKERTGCSISDNCLTRLSHEIKMEKKNYFRSNDEQQIKTVMDGVNKQRPDIHYLVIDTINSVMIADEMRRMKGKNYNEWQDLAKCIFEMIDDSCDFRDDLNIIFIGHTQTDDEGFVRLLTNGRKLNKIGLEKYFDVVLIAKNIDNKYVLETTSPKSTARVPMGCFEGQQYIENDIMKVFEELQEF